MPSPGVAVVAAGAVPGSSDETPGSVEPAAGVVAGVCGILIDALASGGGELLADVWCGYRHRVGMGCAHQSAHEQRCR
jgi:hypothetical protein